MHLVSVSRTTNYLFVEVLGIETRQGLLCMSLWLILQQDSSSLCLQEAEEDLAKKEKEVDENIRVQLQLQEDTSATSKDVKERTVALSAAVKVGFQRMCSDVFLQG